MKVIDRDIEEALHLLGVQIHSQNAIHPRRIQKVGDKFGRDRHPWFVFAVLASIAKEWNDRRDPVRAGSPGGVDHDQEFHQMLVGGRASRLNQENIPASNVLVDFDVGFAVRERANRRLPQRDSHVFADLFGQLAIGAAAENFHLRLKCKHEALNCRAGLRLAMIKTCEKPTLPRLVATSMNRDAISIERPTTNSRIFAHTRWDILPAAAGLFHLAYFIGLFFLFPHAPLWVMLVLGFFYSLMVNANINGVGQHFIHNPFFRSNVLNRAFGITQSIACCFSQTMYDAVHMQHHKGNSDRKDETGDTIDWLSIYRHSHDEEPENPWAYVFKSFFRDDVGAIRKELRKRNNNDALWGNLELAAFATTLFLMAVIVPTWPIHFINW